MTTGPANLVAPDLALLLVAINPPPLSASGGLHFATPTNLFWKLLHGSGLTPTLFAPEGAARLLELGIGIVSFVQRPTKAASELSVAERRDGAVHLTETVTRFRPRMLGLLGLTLLPFLYPGDPDPGPGLKRRAFAGAPVFALPNPSGRNRSYPGLAAKLAWYRKLADAIR